MAIRHLVRKGDCLWGLAHRYLGNGARWPDIFAFHNEEAARFGQKIRLLPIEDENLIFTGQTILIPPRQTNQQPGNGTRAKGGKTAVPIDLKIQYTIGKDTPPVIVQADTLDYTFKVELCGVIGIEMLSEDRHKHGLEIILCNNNPVQLEQKLRQAYDPVLQALPLKVNPKVAVDSDGVKIKAAISAGIRTTLYDLNMNVGPPNHIMGTLSPQPINGTIKVNGRSYKYEVKAEIKAEMTLHPSFQKKSEQVKDLVRVVDAPPIDWKKTIADSGPIMATVAIIIAGSALILTRNPKFACATLGGLIYLNQSRLLKPIIHKINHNGLIQ